MDHPLLSQEQSDLRRRVVQLLKNSYSAHKSGNLVFVCGGNKPDTMRFRFTEHCKNQHPELEIFFPEFAMTDYFSDEADDQFDIADFETLVGELSHAVVVFPEAPGSFAETGYFSLVPDLAKKTVLALDAKYQSKDSFISMGPAKKIADKSLYFPTLQISYEKPNFEEVVARIVRHSLHRNRVQLQITKYEEISSFFLFCLIHQCFEILSTATFADVVFMLRAIFGGVLSVPRVRQLASVLVGAKYLIRIGEFGHYYVNPSKKKLLKIREGKASLQSQILAELGTTYLSSDAEFLRILEGATNAH